MFFDNEIRIVNCEEYAFKAKSPYTHHEFSTLDKSFVNHHTKSESELYIRIFLPHLYLAGSV